MGIHGIWFDSLEFAKRLQNGDVKYALNMKDCIFSFFTSGKGCNTVVKCDVYTDWMNETAHAHYNTLQLSHSFGSTIRRRWMCDSILKFS